MLPSLRHLPCILFLHSDDPGGFDVARWMAGGMSRAQQLCNPLMPSRFGTYSVYNVQERSKLHTDISNYDRTAYESNIASVRENEMHVNEWSQPSFTIPTPPFSLLSISRPGYLESSPLYTPTFLAQATAISQLVDNLRAPALHIVAHKTSAPIALEMAGLPEFRKRIRSICLIDPQLVPHTRIQSLSGQLQLLGPEWARTRAAYNALARSANDSYFRHAVSEICGTESLIEIDDDPAMAQLYEGIGVFFTHWNLRKPGMLRDILTLKRLDRSSWNSVTTPILCLTGIPQPFDGTSRASEMEDHMAAEESAQAALGDVRSKLEFARVYGSGKLLFPLGRVSKTCLDFIYKHK
ncbi:hypothetical protein IW140_001053 [Coemansia sp. RSA 1813]|nr:hypothetical protein IW140_001053 [Coemansia sp. RSA 1813]